MGRLRVGALLLLLAGCILGLHHHIRRDGERLLSDASGRPYAPSFFNRRGQRISKHNGPLKLVMDPFTIFANYPNQHCDSFSIDEHGFRGRWMGGQQDVAMVVGGSAAFGQGLSADDQVFSARLNQMNHRYRFINAAVVGFLSGQELALMVHYLDDYQPKLYVVFDGWNDVCVSGSTSSLFRQQAIPMPLGYNNNYFLEEDRLARYAALMNEIGDAPARPQPLAPLPKEEVLKRIFETYIANVLKMHAFACARHADFLLVFQPDLASKITLTPQELPLLKLSDDFMGIGHQFHEQYMELIKRAIPRLQAEGVKFIDLNGASEITHAAETLFSDPCHPNARGHEIIAGLINRALQEKSTALVHYQPQHQH